MFCDHQIKEGNTSPPLAFTQMFDIYSFMFSNYPFLWNWASLWIEFGEVVTFIFLDWFLQIEITG